MSLKTQVLSIFRKLHRTRQQVFNGDPHALNAGRIKINADFKSNKEITDPTKIKELVLVAEDAERLLRTTVVQGELVAPDTYEVKIRKDIKFGENTIFKPDVILPPTRRKKCSDQKD